MKVWQTILIIVALGTALWVPSPQRANLRKEAGVVEITYMADNGPNAPAVGDALGEFESESRKG
jgi:hypothetical protein